MDNQRDRATAFRALHDRDAPPLRLLNAWDAGSAKVLVAAVAAVRASGIPAFVNARIDTVLLGAGDEAETIARLHAYADAGADGLFVPGATDPGRLARLVASTPLPLNVLAAPALPPVDELARLGVARVSSGSGPARLALSAAYAAAQELLGDPGTYGDGGGLSYDEVNRIMGDTN